MLHHVPCARGYERGVWRRKMRTHQLWRSWSMDLKAVAGSSRKRLTRTLWDLHGHPSTLGLTIHCTRCLSKCKLWGHPLWAFWRSSHLFHRIILKSTWLQPRERHQCCLNRDVGGEYFGLGITSYWFMSHGAIINSFWIFRLVYLLTLSFTYFIIWAELNEYVTYSIPY